MIRRRPALGFTLIELLTVIAVIGVLTALALSSIGKVRESARRTGCASNLRQIGVLIHLHVQENRGRLPGPFWSAFGPYPNDSDRLLVSKLQPYVTNLVQLNGARPHVPLFECPAWALRVPAEHQANGRCYLLGRNARLAGGGTAHPFGYPELGGNPGSNPLMINQLDNPSRTMAISDLDAVNGGTSYASDPGVAPAPVHGQVRNELYFDGRVAAVAVP